MTGEPAWRLINAAMSAQANRKRRSRTGAGVQVISRPWFAENRKNANEHA
jgi:hypothetical protein